MKITVDFDGTCVEHKFPLIGKDNPLADTVLKLLVLKGHQLILNTMRSGLYLEQAVNWFKEKNIKLYGINRDPEQILWTDSPKAYSELNIDDRDIFMKLKLDSSGKSYMVDWEEVYKELLNKKIL